MISQRFAVSELEPVKVYDQWGFSGTGDAACRLALIGCKL